MRKIFVAICLCTSLLSAKAQTVIQPSNDTASPFCFWYWMYGAVTKEAIKADALPLMKVACFKEGKMARSEAVKEVKKQIAEATGIHPFAVGKYMEQCRSFSKKELMGLMELGAELETDVKTGKITDTLSVEVFILQSASIHGKNSSGY